VPLVLVGLLQQAFKKDESIEEDEIPQREIETEVLFFLNWTGTL
jgi:hypothetical protein